MDHDDRLAKLMRQALGATTDGERLAALAAFDRAMEAAGLDLHDIAARLDGTTPAPPPPGEVAEPLESDIAWQAASLVAALGHDDDLWPELAAWLVANDDDWHGAHGRWLLRSKQRQFAEEMREAAESVRPTGRQCAYLLFLYTRVADQLARPEPAAPAQLAAAMAGEPGAAAPPQARDRPPRETTWRRPKPVPQRVASRLEQVQWIRAIVEAWRLGPRPAEDAPGLFSDAELRVLAWFGAGYEQWLIERPATATRPAKPTLRIGKLTSAAAMAAAAQVSLRTVRRALAKAAAAGYLAVETPGGGRGRATVYRLTLPPRRWRHADIPAQQPRRQSLGRRAAPKAAQPASRTSPASRSR